MTAPRCDIAIAGGGLAGGLIALALARQRPELRLALVEAGERLGGNHRWSWFASDLPPGGETLLSRFRKTQWDEGYDVVFPAFARRLATPYRSLAADDFDAALRRELPAEAIRCRSPIAALDAGGIELENGERIAARAVIDCRGFAPTPHLSGGWQVFMGRYIRTAAPHGLDRPVVMDAGVTQLGGYRFVYLLPLGAHELLIEDTYYADAPVLDRSALSSRIDAYCAENGWSGEILGHETGVLPVVTGGDFGAWQRSAGPAGVTLAGARGGFWHPLTSYTLPQAAAVALMVAENADLPGDQLAALIASRARAHWRRTSFYRRLGRMLFGAAEPERRYRVLERFYRLPRPLIERFYAARSTAADRRRVLCGRPPVPIGRALGALFGKGRPLILPGTGRGTAPGLAPGGVEGAPADALGTPPSAPADAAAATSPFRGGLA